MSLTHDKIETTPTLLIVLTILVVAIGGLDGLLPPEAVYRFDLDTAEEDGTWRVRSTRWEQVTATPSP